MKATKFTPIACVFALASAAALVASDPPKHDPAKQDPSKPQPDPVTYVVNVADSTTTKADPAAGTFVKVDDPQAAELAKFGSRLIERIGGMLVSEVNRELAAKEVVDSIDVMHLKQLELPKAQPGQPKVTGIKRTSSMLRDPANTPDAADQAALDRIHMQLMNNEAPDKLIVQKIEHKDQPVEWRVYRPIATTQSCLACHGDPEKFTPAVREILNRRYPGDKAIDYRRQEYRGVLRVSLQAPEPAKK